MNGRLVDIAGLTDGDRQAMYALLDRHFAGLTPRQFAADLAGKTHALLLTHSTGRLVGFSTLRYRPASTVAGTDTAVVYSGDTIVDPAAWGSTALMRLWLRSVLDLHHDSGAADRPLVWLLISSGYRTYRFLPVFWQRFFPRYDQPTATEAQASIDQLAAEQFGRAYDPRRGIVRFAAPQRLRDHLARVPDRKRTDPHVAFFQRANPGWREGDELVCCTWIDPANLTRTGRRMLGDGRAASEGATAR